MRLQKFVKQGYIQIRSHLSTFDFSEGEFRVNLWNTQMQLSLLQTLPAIFL